MPTGLDAETLQMVLSAIEDFAAKCLPGDMLRELDDKDECPEGILREMYGPQFGIHLLFIPEEYGGMGGGAYDVYRVSEAISRIDLGLGSAVLATFLGLDPIIVGGTPEQKALWMRKVAEQGMLVAYGVTEPTAGSDLAVIRTWADPVTEDGRVVGYRLNGNKQFITNGGIADLYTILAKAPGGFTFFIIEKGAEGFTAGKAEDKHGIRISNTAPLTLEDVFVPVENLVGGVEGQGMIQAQEVFGFTRLMVAAFGLGGGMASLERAVRYAKERVQAGSPLIDKQAFTHKLLVPHAVRLEVSRAYVEEVSRRIDAGEGDLGTEGAIAKLIATEAGNAAADAAIQALGGYGYTREYTVERIRRDLRITTIYEGTSEIMEWTIARDRWRDHLQTRGQYYAQMAASIDALQSRAPDVGADLAALAFRALNVLLEIARVGRLTRNQHILFRLGEWIAFAESAASMARYAADGSEKVSGLEGPAIQAMSRIYARQAALHIATEGVRWIAGAQDATSVDELGAALALPAILRAQHGLLADMDLVAEALRDASW
ncbi:MAG: acyl-CoA dehydrogenase family protein [Anaerolineae bacterium]|nr:acyl-CoA dehydrogenase family protein [Anaerolineae bacterium]